MRILMLCYEFPPLGGGGSKVVYGLSKELVRLGHEVDIVTMGFRGLPRYEEVNGARVFRVSFLRKNKHVCTVPEAALYVLSALMFVRRLTSQHRYDINHTHFIFPDGVLAWSIKRYMQIPYVITAHGSDVPGYNPHKLKVAHKLMAPLWAMVIRNASWIICPSKSLHSLLTAASGVDKNTTEIPNGIDLGKFTHDKPKINRILVVTRMLERKGVQHVLTALEGLTLDHEVHIVGDGPYLPTLRQMAQATGIRVTFWGWLDGQSPELKELFETSGVFVFPSEAENFPIVLLEAMAAGMAIITTKETGCAEVVGEAALLVKSGDAEAIRAALIFLANNPEYCRELGKAARQRLEENFGWATVAKRHVALYEKVINKQDRLPFRRIPALSVHRDTVPVVVPTLGRNSIKSCPVPEHQNHGR
jgi:glycosyltransferase involved in cell wall biosynthesis